jgi:hypothetical protein
VRIKREEVRQPILLPLNSNLEPRTSKKREGGGFISAICARTVFRDFGMLHKRFEVRGAN